MEIRKLEDFVVLAKAQKTKKRIVVAAAHLQSALNAVKEAAEMGIVTPILVGDKAKINKIAADISWDISKINIIDQKDNVKAIIASVALIREGKADILMKGIVATKDLLKIILDKEIGLRKEKIISHIAFFESPYYHKLFCITDAAMAINPDLATKTHMINNAVTTYIKLGIEKPKVAILAPVEVVNPEMEATVHAALLTQMNRRGQIKNCIVDGPLSLDNIISKKAAQEKGIDSEVAGDTDIIVTPDINTGNTLYKSLNFLGGTSSAAIVTGAIAPIVLTSRSDDRITKLMSIALAAALKQ